MRTARLQARASRLVVKRDSIGSDLGVKSRTGSSLPHARQRLADSRFSWPHPGQNFIPPVRLSVEPEESVKGILEVDEHCGISHRKLLDMKSEPNS
jgi:hypothetical protein